MAWDASDGYVLLWGGQSTSGGLLRDTWTYANGTWTNLTTIVGASPPSAPFQVVAYDPSSQKIVMFSGQNNTTWTYHNQVWANVTASAGAHPPAVIGESFVTDTTDNEAVFFGGQYIYLNGLFPHATWVFKNGGWSNISSTAPFQFGRVVLPFGADDPPDHGILAVGLAEWSNITPLLYRMSTYLFSGGSWTNLTLTLPQEPPISELPGFGYLPSITADVLVVPIVVNSTGQVGSTLGVTWEFRHSVWTNVTSVTGAQPDVGLITGSAVDPVDGTMLVFGGQQTHLFFTPYFYPATWLMSAPPTVTASISRASVDAGQPVTFTAIASGGASPVTTRWNFGDGT